MSGVLNTIGEILAGMAKALVVIVIFTLVIAFAIFLLAVALVVAFGVPVGIAFLLFAAARWLWFHV